LRLSGAEPAVAWAATELGGEAVADSEFWTALRDHRLPLFTDGGPGQQPLWRCSLPPATPAPLERCLTVWGGAERWVRPADEAAAARLGDDVRTHGGHARPFDGSFGQRAGRHVPEPEARYAIRLKQAFDPAGTLNPGLSPRPDACRAD
jgi:glycolate oxidase FAD binding subunit